MKRFPTNYVEDIGPATLYLDDLEEVVHCLAALPPAQALPPSPGELQLGAGEDAKAFEARVRSAAIVRQVAEERLKNDRAVQITSTGMIFESVEDVGKSGLVLRDLQLSIGDPRIEVKFWRYGVEVRLYPDSTIGRGFTECVRSVVRRRQRWYALPIRAINRYWLSFVAFGMVPMLATSWVSRHLPEWVLLAVLVWAATWLVCMFAAVLPSSHRAVIYPYAQGSKEGFFKRNGEKLALGAISAMIGGAIALLFKWLLP